MKFLKTVADTNSVRDLKDVRNFRLIDVSDYRLDYAKLSYARNGQSAATDWMDQNNLSNQIIKIVHNVDMNDELREAYLGEMFRDGVELDVDTDGKKYVRLGQGASDARQCKTVFATETFKEQFLNWYCLGRENRELIFQKMKPEKVWIYNLQAFSSSSLWVNSFPSSVVKFMPEPDLDKIAVFKDMELSHGKKDVKFLQGEIAKELQAEIVEKDSDGLILIIIHDMDLSDDDRAELNDLIRQYMVQAFSIRMPGVKGLVVPVLETAVRRILKTGKTKADLYGVEHDLSNLDMVLFTSSFKWAGVFNTPELWQSYKDGFRTNGHSIRVCKQNHPNAWRRLPAQQMQAIVPSAEESVYLRHIAIDPLLKNSTKEGIFGLISNVWQRKVAKLYPAFLGEYTLKNSMQTKHITAVKQAMEGCLPNVLRYTFCAPDILTVICHIGGIDLQYCIEEGCVSVDMNTVTVGKGDKRKTVPLTPYGEDTIVTRNPTPGLGVCVLKNIKIPDQYRGLYLGNTCFISVKGIEMRTLSMDYDGDTVGIMSCYWKYARYYAEALTRAKSLYNYLCVYFENAKSKSLQYSDEVYNNMLVQERSSQVGIVIDGITRLIDILMEKATMGTPITKEDMTKFSILEGAATLVIDAAKNGEDQDVQKTIAKANEILEKLRRSARPIHTFWKKEVKTGDLEDRDFCIKRTKQDLMAMSNAGAPMFVRRQNWMGDYVASIENSVEGKLPIDEWVRAGEIPAWIPGTARGKIKSKNIFMNGPANNFATLFRLGSVEYENGKTDWSATVFGRIVDEYLHIKEDLKSAKLLQEVVETKSIEWKSAIFNEGLIYGKDSDETLACLIHACYLHGDDLDKSRAIIASNAKEVLWILFGEDIYNNVKRNINLNPEELAAKLGDDIDDSQVDYEGMIFTDDEADMY